MIHYSWTMVRDTSSDPTPDPRPAVGAPESRIGAATTASSTTASATASGAPRPPDDRRSDRPVAIIVSHGMGEQVPFETLNSVAAALWSRQSKTPLAASDSRVRYVAFGDDWLPRVELTLTVNDTTQREVHLYEVYWAPLTEGKVTLRDVLAFLTGAGLRGIRYCARGSFDRWMFDSLTNLPLRRRGVFQLGAALAVLLVLTLSFGALALVGVAELFRLVQPGALPAGPAWLDAASTPALLGALGGGALFFAALRWFLVQSVGDVVAYVSAHRASRFTEIRSGIQSAARKVARNVYASRIAETGELEYGDVIIVGHSLGSVIAYDMLNDSINGDLLARGSAGEPLNVVGRTKLLLTMGSPLDKTAFIFRTQKDAAPLREALAAAAQPMIVSYENRPARWINIWSPFDWVSGSLDYYDATPPGDDRPVAHTSTVDVSSVGNPVDTSTVDVSRKTSAAASGDPTAACTESGSDPSAPAPRSHPRAVENIREGGVPLDTVRAHLGYWKRAEFGKRVFDALAGCGSSGGGVSAAEAQLPEGMQLRSRIER